MSDHTERHSPDKVCDGCEPPVTSWLSLSAIREQLAGIEGERWEYMPAMTDDAIIMHHVYDDEGHCIAECSSPTLAAFIAAAPSTVERLLGALERVEALADEWFRELENPDHLILLEDALVAIRAALTGEGA